MKKIFIINGAARSGKDTFVETVREVSGIILHNISSVGNVKEAATILGWDGKKDERGRQFLSDLKDISSKVYNGPLSFMLANALCITQGLIFFHIREPDEITELKKKCEEHSLDVSTILLKRPDITQFTNHADQNVENFEYDYIINNDGSIKKLKKQVITWFKGLQLQ